MSTCCFHCPSVVKIMNYCRLWQYMKVLLWTKLKIKHKNINETHFKHHLIKTNDTCGCLMRSCRSLLVEDLSVPGPLFLYMSLLLDCACYGGIGMYWICKYRGTLCLYYRLTKICKWMSQQLYPISLPPASSCIFSAEYCELLHVSLLWIIMYLFIGSIIGSAENFKSRIDCIVHLRL